jgi:hypothetical protein
MYPSLGCYNPECAAKLQVTSPQSSLQTVCERADQSRAHQSPGRESLQESMRLVIESESVLLTVVLTRAKSRGGDRSSFPQPG